MSLISFAREYDELSSNDQAQFAVSIQRLLAEGIIWREDENDYRIYSFLVRRRELVQDYLSVAGWELRFDERLAIFQAVHRDGAHRRRLNRDTTIWLLLLRLLYAEARESNRVSLTRYPVVTVGEVYTRYSEFFPSKAVRKKTSLDGALRTLQSLKLIRAALGGNLRALDSEQQIELLPTLEVAAPASEIAQLAENLREYETGPSKDEETDENSD